MSLLIARRRIHLLPFFFARPKIEPSTILTGNVHEERIGKDMVLFARARFALRRLALHEPLMVVPADTDDEHEHGAKGVIVVFTRRITLYAIVVGQRQLE